MKILLRIIIIFLSLETLHAQTITDGLMMPKNTFCTGFMYGHNSWKNYWEGTVRRENGNIGTITTNSVTWMGTYGLSPKINLIAMVPYITTKASGGTLHGMAGIQDLTLAVKYNLFKTKIDSSTFQTFVGLAYSNPLSNYSADYFPLALGTSSKQLAWRLTLTYTLKQGWYANASTAYVWRSNVTIDRSSYYANDQLNYGNNVYMPNVFDMFLSVGYHKQALQVEVNYTQQNVLGGSDIRRQDMPFVSNRMNASRVNGLVMYYLPRPKYLAVRASAGYTVAGRNVGQSTTIMGGLMYTLFFSKKK